MQEEVENRTLTLVVSGTKFTGRLFKAAITKMCIRDRPFTLSDAMGRILMDEPLRPGEGILHHPEEMWIRDRFFTEQLIAAGVDRETAEQDACRMEHVISQESFERCV